MPVTMYLTPVDCKLILVGQTVSLATVRCAKIQRQWPKYRVSTVSPVIPLERSCNLTESSTVPRGSIVWPWIIRRACIAIDINDNDLELQTLTPQLLYSLHR